MNYKCPVCKKDIFPNQASEPDGHGTLTHTKCFPKPPDIQQQRFEFALMRAQTNISGLSVDRRGAVMKCYGDMKQLAEIYGPDIQYAISLMGAAILAGELKFSEPSRIELPPGIEKLN